MSPAALALRLLALLAVANSAPIVAKRALGRRCACPLDGGLRFVDGRRLLGPAKTWRGVAVAVVATAAAAPLLGVPARVGGLLGIGAMVGDALSSFTKRRMGVPASGRAAALDQIPEALLPLLAVRAPLHLSPALVAAVTAAFFVLERPVARLAFRLGLRDQPY